MKLIVRSLDDLPRIASEILVAISNAGFVAFYGEMGAGKTTLIKALLRQLNASDEGCSPTFSLVNEYRSADNSIIYHFDFYRINSIDEVFDMGYEEYFYGDSRCFVEWPEKIESLLPSDAFRIYISELEDRSREITIAYPA